MAVGAMTSFFEIAGLVLSVAQMIFHYEALDDYREKLEEMAEQLKEWADKNRGFYNEFRGMDPAFYAYYQGLPDYGICESNILRAKGGAFQRMGANIRSTRGANRGFTPLANVNYVNTFAEEPIQEVAVNRAITRIKEMERVNDHVIQRWQAIASTPIGVERHSSVTFDKIINQSFKSLMAHGQGFNAAGSAFGASVYNILN